MPAMFDVVVVGGGPSGAACARTLAERGLEACVIDRAAPPRYKTCGGGLVARAYAQLELELDAVVERELSTIEINLLDEDLRFEVRRDEPPVVMTMRAQLDDAVLRGAREAGARLLAPCALRGLVQSADQATLSTDLGPIRCRYVVAADGAASPTARAAGWAPNPRNVPALESELAVGDRELERFAGTARFDFGPVPRGYAWVFPKRDHLSVGCLSARLDGVSLPQLLDRWLERIGLDPHAQREDHGYVIPAAPRRRLTRGRVLLTGDAAGLADPITYEGISNALLSGRLAAESVAEDFARPDRVRRTFERRLRQEILRELRLARLLARLLYGFPGFRDLMFRRLGQRMSEAMTDVFGGQRTYRDLVARPATYLRIVAGLLRGPGRRPGS